MRRLAFLMAALAASPAMASTSMGSVAANGPAVDMLFPEIAVDDDGWRGLLPVILIDPLQLSDHAMPAEQDSARRSERDGER